VKEKFSILKSQKTRERKKKAIFHLCLIVCPILIGPLLSCPLSPCPILCYLQLFWRTRNKSADFLSAPGGDPATLKKDDLLGRPHEKGGGALH